jgi:hypothetical protein
VLVQKPRNRSSDVRLTTVPRRLQDLLPTFGHGKDAIRLDATVPLGDRGPSENSAPAGPPRHHSGAVTPRRCTRRVASATTNSTYSRCSSSVSTQKKSVARMPRACTRRNCRQLGPSRRGAGSIPARWRINHTVLLQSGSQAQQVRRICALPPCRDLSCAKRGRQAQIPLPAWPAAAPGGVALTSSGRSGTSHLNAEHQNGKPTFFPAPQALWSWWPPSFHGLDQPRCGSYLSVGVTTCLGTHSLASDHGLSPAATGHPGVSAPLIVLGKRCGQQSRRSPLNRPGRAPSPDDARHADYHTVVTQPIMANYAAPGCDTAETAAPDKIPIGASNWWITASEKSRVMPDQQDYCQRW